MNSEGTQTYIYISLGFLWRLHSPWTEEPGELQSRGCKESDTTEWLSTAYSTHYIGMHVCPVASVMSDSS